ncbi:MAG: bifunctional molybdenum cofactor guanylyltransferase MobA/molybdopterin-guanine dinucleotide biosynthesis adaptor protein MobB [Chlorobium sp.]|nr:bifunctional molybdenum cofactor guanylyltransferase MobA/molybdopterin-guanine dinucleotide biosynthesis adaptor protein MobB [Chlorobium phaeovibrioides]NQU46048.1 bifunctional molybdenum cofactor guanylyltransferase MobA/molybdopterin-guanine dinucleotide biosynthesis adaptor protein MobB [Chlorobium sp.]
MNTMLFHPFELAFSGWSGSGKTTLATAIIRILSERFRVGYYKHGCHRFDIDRKGKDSELATSAGAHTVMISDPEKTALIAGPNQETLERQAFLDCDILLVEGLKDLPLPKIVMAEGEQNILDLSANGSLTNIVAFAFPDSRSSSPIPGIPAFNRNDASAIADFIINHMLRRATRRVPLSAIVAAGGRSSRMGTDKALLRYHDSNQLIHTAELLKPFCSEVFISCRDDQAKLYAEFGIPLLTDSYLGIGPLGGLLSAQKQNPDSAWIMLACDLPFLDSTTVRRLAEERDPFRFATALCSPESGMPEPLAACYEPKSRTRLLLRHAEGINSPASFLAASRICELHTTSAETMFNINTPEERALWHSPHDRTKDQKQ